MLEENDNRELLSGDQTVLGRRYINTVVGEYSGRK